MAHAESSGLSAPSAARGWVRQLDAPALLISLVCALLLAAFCAVPFLPMVDLPQHAAQLRIWLQLTNPASSEAQRFALNLRTPYVGAYLAAWVLAHEFSVLLALKVVVWLSIVGQVAAFEALLRRLGYTRWLALLGVPMSLGYGFYFGFISFNAALPCGLLAMSAALDHRAEPTLRHGLWLAATLCATLATHGFVLAMTLAVALPLLLRGAGSISARVAPLAAPLLLAAVWLVPGSSAQSIGLTVWDPRLLDLGQVPALLLAASAADHFASVVGVASLSLVACHLGRPSREPERYLPLLSLLLGYCLFPLSLGGFGPLHPRFVAYMVPALLIAFEPRRRALPAMPLLIGVTCLSWCAVFGLRLLAFSRETRPISNFVARMPAGLRVRPVVFERTSEAFPGLPAFLHLSAYYAAEKGGIQGYSFAMYPTSVIRYLPSVIPTMTHGAEWSPELFSTSELDSYDCILVHSHRDRTLELFRSRAADVRLAFREADWWTYLTPSYAGREQTGVSTHD